MQGSIPSASLLLRLGLKSCLRVVACSAVFVVSTRWLPPTTPTEMLELAQHSSSSLAITYGQKISVGLSRGRGGRTHELRPL